MPKKKKRKATAKWEKVIRDLVGADFDSKSSKKKKYSGEWDECDDNSDSNLPTVIIQESVPIAFENNLTYNERKIREGNDGPDWMILDPLKDGGFHFGSKKWYNDNHYVGKPQGEDGHILIVGTPGSHKTSGLVIPTFATWQGHIIAVDVKPKGDLLAQCEKMSRPLGKTTLVFNPYKNDSCHFDPFAFLRFDGKGNLPRNAKELALCLISMIPGDHSRVWIQSSQSLLAGIFVLYVDMGLTFSKAMETIQLLSVEDLIAMINGSKNNTAKMFISKLKGLKEETLAGIGMDLVNLAILAADPLIQSVLSPDKDSVTIDWNWLNTSTEPINIVLQLPEENLEVWEPMTKLLINQLIKTLQRRDDKPSPQGKNLQPVLVMLDEFASLGELSSIKKGLATLRSRGVTFCLIMQSLSQLESIYNPVGMRDILDLCTYKAILNVTDPTSQKYFSDMIGSMIVAGRGVSTNHKFGTDEMSNYSLQINELREPIIFPHEFATLKDIVLLTPDGYCRIDKAPYYKQLPIVDSSERIDIQ